MTNEIVKGSVQAGLGQNCSDEEFLARVFSDTNDAEEEYVLLNVPTQLSEGLHAIPRKSGPGFRKMTRIIAVSSIAASVLFVFMIFTPGFKQSAQELKILQAKQDLAVAFSYLQKANERAGNNIHSTIARGLTKSTIKPVVKTIYDIKSS